MKFLKRHKKAFLYVISVMLAAVLLYVGHNVTTGEKKIFGKLAGAQVYTAKVEMILVRQEVPVTIDNEVRTNIDVTFNARVLSGDKRGDILIAQQKGNVLMAVPIKPVEEGDRVMVCYLPYDGEYIWAFQEYDRSIPLLILLVAFFALLLIFGGKKGIGTILSLCFTALCIFYFFLPAILSGWNIYALTVICCIYIIAVTLILVNGFNYKSFSAAMGCLGGLMVSGFLFVIADKYMKLTGMVDEDSSYLLFMETPKPIDLKAIIFASVLIGVLGAVLDVGVSIASSLHEIHNEREDITFKEIFASGMNIGRDILCTMTNTLILAYIGGALSLTILLIAYSNSFLELLNRETIVVEVLQALLGSIGLLFTIPITTVIYGFALTKKKNSPEPMSQKSEPPEEKEPLKLESVGRLKEKEESLAEKFDEYGKRL